LCVGFQQATPEEDVALGNGQPVRVTLIEPARPYSVDRFVEIEAIDIQSLSRRM